MTKVKRYHLTETGLVEGESLGRLSVVLAADYDAAVEQIAQLEQLNVLGQETVTLGLNTTARLVAERDALQLQLNQRDERIDRLEADKRAMTETHVLYTWLRKKCDQSSNDVVAVHMNIGHDWATVRDLDTDLRAMIDREEP